MNIIVTGGAGFIGSNFLLRVTPAFPEHTFINVDALTYAGNPLSLAPIADCANYRFEHLDIADFSAVERLFAACRPDAVVHFAAESHVDRSLVGPAAFVQTNVVGTFNLLESCRKHWLGKATPTADGPSFHRFHHVSTDEVYGSLGDQGAFSETTPYDPSSPYSASKAASDHWVRAYARSYGLNTTVTNCSNNYGPRQFPEKLIPLTIANAVDGKPLPVYGEGKNIRDWLYVDDHCDAIWQVFTRAKAGKTYNVGGNCELRNLAVVRLICTLVGEELAARHMLSPAGGDLQRLITFVTDRPGHDFRYAMDTTRIAAELSWRPNETFASGLRKTVRWYLDNSPWLAAIRSGEYRQQAAT